MSSRTIQAALRQYPTAYKAVYPEPIATRQKRAWKLAYGLAREWEHRFEGVPSVLVDAAARTEIERLAAKRR